MMPTAPSTPEPDPPEAASEAALAAEGPSVFELPADYADVVADPDTQFEPLAFKTMKPREPSAFEEWLNALFEWLGEVFAPLGKALAGSWPVLQWVLLAALAAFVIYCVYRLVGPLADRRKAGEAGQSEEPDWQPDRAQTLALLEDADRLAAQGRYDEAARLLLQRSVGHIAKARPDWVDPSSTARELAAIPRLSDAARRAFAVISEAVERSLFALNPLSREDWERARGAYTDFALARIDAGQARRTGPAL